MNLGAHCQILEARASFYRPMHLLVTVMKIKQVNFINTIASHTTATATYL